ncbi:hypothetical protein D3C87_1769430 [compost metagenome]
MLENHADMSAQLADADLCAPVVETVADLLLAKADLASSRRLHHVEAPDEG